MIRVITPRDLGCRPIFFTHSIRKQRSNNYLHFTFAWTENPLVRVATTMPNAEENTPVDEANHGCPVKMYEGRQCGRPLHKSVYESDGVNVCLMHTTDPRKDDTEFQNEIRRIASGAANGIADFSGFVFPCSKYLLSEFSAKCVFVGAKFIQDANFEFVRFGGGADFRHATFAQAAQFIKAQFVQEALFDEAIFSGETHFGGRGGRPRGGGVGKWSIIKRWCWFSRRTLAHY